MISPAAMLQGKKLEGGWTVLSPVPKLPGATGGYFSKCYIVEGPNKERAFLKALDYSLALQDSDPARALQALTEAFNFEREVMDK